MVLINCPECGTEVSQKASACIKCGCPIAAHNQALSDKAQGYEAEQEPRSLGSQNPVDEDSGIDMVAQLEACFARRNYMILAILGVLILLMPTLVCPSVANGLLLAFRSFGVTFSNQTFLNIILVGVLVLSSAVAIVWAGEFLTAREFFFRPQEIDWDEVLRLDSAEDAPLRGFWDGLPKRHGGVFFNMRVSTAVGHYVINYEFRFE